MLNHTQFFPIRVESVPTNRPITFELYVRVNTDYVLFRKTGDLITDSRMVELLNHKLKQFYIPLEQRDLYKKNLIDTLRRDDLSPQLQAKFIKEAAFNHIQDLFTNKSVDGLVGETTELITEMVNLISDDLEGAANLMKLSRHDYYTYNHSVNVSVYTIAIAKKILGPDKGALIKAGLGGLLHDLGKRAVSRDIINKPGKLTPQEWEEIKMHPTHGYTLLQKVSILSEETKRIVHEHHENIDGTGYPGRLKEAQISLFAKIATIADVFDALTTNRSYKNSVPPNEALQIMFAMAPGKFDPELFRFFDKSVEKKHKLTLDKDCDPCSTQVKLKKTG